MPPHACLIQVRLSTDVAAQMDLNVATITGVTRTKYVECAICRLNAAVKGGASSQITQTILNF